MQALAKPYFEFITVHQLLSSYRDGLSGQIMYDQIEPTQIETSFTSLLCAFLMQLKLLLQEIKEKYSFCSTSSNRKQHKYILTDALFWAILPMSAIIKTYIKNIISFFLMLFVFFLTAFLRSYTVKPVYLKHVDKRFLKTCLLK